ncbi:putative dehydrogenase [Lewinella aquimaris]|uniref:Putative dehydrogenase n=1 Tax=Neolewinella aquimaris TaxID=1835722 RepID=A0A840EAL1_9BACT|nr:Gfo/Idh/MocA family oxidoreductase [Neolewinella aquimaris]MBB4078849.1 putative dehydrogenase [Neolewinella aquimaris]
MPSSRVFSAPVNWGIIGCGNVTEVKSGPAYQQTEGFQLAAVMRRDVEKLEDYARRHQVKKTYSDADELIQDPAIDAIYIATPPDTHRYYGLKVAAAGKPCCIEKPLAPSYEDSRAITTAFQEKNLPLFVAYYRRSLPRFVQVKRWLDEGAIGAVRHVSWQLNKPPGEYDRSGEYNWRTDPTVAPGGYFDDLASHGLDLLTYFLGDIRTVHGISLNQQGLYAAKDAITACWQHGSGATGMGCWNFGSAIATDRVEIFGSSGKISFPVFEDQPLFLEGGGAQEQCMIENPATVQLPHVENMKRQLLDGIPHPSTGKSALHTSWVMDQILGRTGAT